jgi:tetratricopeptide (TPR) repeat protein
VHHPLHLTEEMRRFAQRAAGQGSAHEQARRLYKAILDYGLQVRYDEDLSRERRPGGCKTARQVFEEVDAEGRRFALCLEYTLLYVALGRAVGLQVCGLRWRESPGGGQGFLFGHVAAGVGDPEGGLALVDLANRRFWQDPEGFEEVSDRRLLAYFHNNTGIILSLQGRLEEADSAFSRALELDAGLPAFWYNRGCVRLRGGDPSSASRDLVLAARLDPSSVPIQTNLAVAESALGRKRQARARLYLARTLQPDARVAFNLGVLAWEEGDRASAERYWREALAIDPAYQQARRWLAALLQESGRREEGLRVLGGL